MRVYEGMNEVVLSVGPGHTLRAAARLMSERKVGAAVVIDPDAPGPGILTERDVLSAVGEGSDPDAERVADHLTSDVVFAAPDWSLEEAAAAMVRGGFRHLLVVESGEVVGIISVRDIVRSWTEDGAICPVPAAATQGQSAGRFVRA
jgi:CBS domain-containing protein